MMNPSSMAIVFAIVIAMLYFGKAILIPVGISILVSFALAPPVVRLRRLGLPRIPAVIAVVLVVSIVLSGLAFVVATQLFSLADNLYSYQYNITRKIHLVRDAMPSGGTLERVTTAIRDIGKEIDQATKQDDQPAAAPPAGEVQEQKPTPVEVHQPPPTAIQTLESVLGPLVEPVVTTGLIIIFVIFMLIERTELRDRLIRLIDEEDLARATKAIDDAAKRVSRYLLMQLLVAIIYGVPYGIGLWLIGVPSPLLWGLLATLLRFVPYIGPFIAAVAPLALAVAVDPGWTKVIEAGALIVVLEMFTSNVLEPWLYGSTTGLSPVAILVAAVFWTTLWGPIGLLLSVPLTVCLVVLGRHVPQLAFLELMLGDRPALTIQERIYQRLLAGDRHEATELAETFEDQHGFLELADEVLIAVLRLAEADRERRVLDSVTQNRIAATMEEIGAFLVESEPHLFDGPDAVASRPRVLCVGGRHALDVASAAVLARALEVAELDARVISNVELRPAEFASPEEQPAIVCVAYLSPPSVQHARRLARRLRAAIPGPVPIIACDWFDESDVSAPPERAADFLTHTVRDAVAQVRGRLGLPPLPVEEDEEAKVERTKVTPPEPAQVTANA